jgi:hypothetical protein
MWRDINSIHSVQAFLPWILALGLTFYATVSVGIFLYRRSGQVPVLFKLWLLVCFFILSPWRYFIFQSVWFLTYAVQSLHNFYTSLLLYLYVPFVFMVPVLVASLGIYYLALYAYSKKPSRPTLAFLSLAVPSLMTAGTVGYFLLLPFLARTVYWIPRGEVIAATRGPVAYAFKYLGSPGYPMVSKKHAQTLFFLRPVERHITEIYMKSSDRDAFSRTITSEPLARPKSPPE